MGEFSSVSCTESTEERGVITFKQIVNMTAAVELSTVMSLLDNFLTCVDESEFMNIMMFNTPYGCNAITWVLNNFTSDVAMEVIGVLYRHNFDTSATDSLGMNLFMHMMINGSDDLEYIEFVFNNTQMKEYDPEYVQNVACHTARSYERYAVYVMETTNFAKVSFAKVSPAKETPLTKDTFAKISPPKSKIITVSTKLEDGIVITTRDIVAEDIEVKMNPRCCYISYTNDSKIKSWKIMPHPLMDELHEHEVQRAITAGKYGVGCPDGGYSITFMHEDKCRLITKHISYSQCVNDTPPRYYDELCQKVVGEFVIQPAGEERNITSHLKNIVNDFLSYKIMYPNTVLFKAPTKESAPAKETIPAVYNAPATLEKVEIDDVSASKKLTNLERFKEEQREFMRKFSR